ncbi:hypothetical protein QQ045_021073 [Rhodiola kirilowii]
MMLQFQKDSANQVIKAAMAINAQVLSEMVIPENYIESLPKNGRALVLETQSTRFAKRRGNCLKRGQKPYCVFSISGFLAFLSLHSTSAKYNRIRDVGQAILESYSRILESLAFKVISRIEDVQHADSLAQNPSGEEKRDRCLVSPIKGEDHNLPDGPISMTLSDFMGWNFDQADTEQKKDSADDLSKHMTKVSNISTTPKKVPYIEKLENLGGMRSPTERH